MTNWDDQHRRQGDATGRHRSIEDGVAGGPRRQEEDEQSVTGSAYGYLSQPPPDQPFEDQEAEQERPPEDPDRVDPERLAC